MKSEANQNQSSQIRELSIGEVELVTGGDALTGFNWGVAAGTVGGAVVTGSTIGATRAGIIGGALGFAFGFGYGVGTAFSNHYF
jgi:hypothetical protein